VDNPNLERRRITLFLALAFGISWATGGVIALTGGLANSPEMLPNISLAFILLATFYMWGPALANLLTRLFTQEGLKYSGLSLRLRQSWPFWLVAWVLPAILVIAGAALYFVLFPAFFDPEASTFMAQVEQVTGAPLEMPLMTFALLQTFQAVLISPLINGLATFGEEFGWRAYLLPKLLPLGSRRAMIISGVIWGVWHWPVIAMGYNYGFNYPGFPWLGFLGMVWFCITYGIIIGWLTLRGGSVWPAVIAHGAINGIASLGLIFLSQDAQTLLGPTPVGFIAVIPSSLVALFLLLHPTEVEGDTLVPPVKTGIE
jgi:membrane protease YdiL (CAAX protease family)